MNSKTLLMIIIVSVIGFTSPSSWAGSQSDAAIQHAPEKIVKFAKDVEKYAASKGARAFIIARMGRPEKELPAGIRFTHTAVALYSNITLDNGETVQGYAIHNLYQKTGQSDKSELVIDYPVDFFWGAHELKAGILIPSVEVQEKLIQLIASGKDKSLHNENYSVIANPFNNRFQNCTEYTLDLLNAAIYDTQDVAQLKVNAKAHFKAQRVKTSPLKLMFGSMFMDDVSTKDHKGKVYTSTFTTIGEYLRQNQLSEEFIAYTDSGDIESL
ncbi:DUF2145 domain-containing protein [Aliiglaciecola lipolytica]|uniref:DUF2145 domain-containing protein n=1 Tax=Aliiglaciecola lipolytica E3 TaxID=1127673 RepID=K6X1S6_9ALTE|nr:DUF2145 domain-containing protein [Aliiglaciecola lipolytica]GAC14614.1 hypothetical protein GLIP_1986 [Aliiglaciecola lipolytica E3]